MAAGQFWLPSYTQGREPTKAPSPQVCPVPFFRGLHSTSSGGSVLTTIIYSLWDTVIISAPRERKEHLVNSECSVFSLQFPFVCWPLEPPALASSPLKQRGHPRYGLMPSSVGRGCSLCVLASSQDREAQVAPQDPRSQAPTLLCRALAAAGSEASEGPAPDHQGAARAPHSPARSGAAGILPARAARHPNPDPSYPPRECLRPAAGSPSPNGFPEPRAANSFFSASQDGRRPAQQLSVPERAGLVTSRGGAAQARWASRKAPGSCLCFLWEVRDVCAPSSAFRGAMLLDGVCSSIWRLGSSSYFFSSFCERRKILPTLQNCFEIRRTTKWWNFKFQYGEAYQSSLTPPRLHFGIVLL